VPFPDGFDDNVAGLVGVGEPGRPWCAGIAAQRRRDRMGDETKKQPEQAPAKPAQENKVDEKAQEEAAKERKETGGYE
jgi:hypothetical protein